ncbi:unnamed protein product [Ophioblennius macclurei]
MESRFAHLRQRDTSVSMLRTKLSRRRSQSQKENRERAVNTRRQLSELDKVVEEKSVICKGDDRMKQLERWKERKALEKEKAKRERERKGVFKTGLYRPKDTLDVAPLPDVPGASIRAKGKKMDLCQSTRVTRSMKQQPLKMGDPNIVATKAQPSVEKASRTRVASVKPVPVTAKINTGGAVRALSTRSSYRPPVTAAFPEKDKAKSKAADVRITRSRATDCPMAPFTGREKEIKETVQPAVLKQPTQMETQHSEEIPPAPRMNRCPQEDNMVVERASEESAPPVDPAKPPPPLTSFAPEGFVFKAPVGLTAFKFEPMTPRSADAFLTPSPIFILPPAPAFTDDPQAEPGRPSPRKYPRTSPSVDPPAPCSSLESKHDVPYFRSEIASETDKLTALSLHWESKVEDQSIPEEMRDCMRTAVGQARLLMKERFKQFSGLVDDCELGRGDKITTCTDLQGFWDMVYYQVEDVSKKFDALKESEGRGWVEEHKPPPRQRKAVKKPSAAPAKPAGGKAAAAKSRLAAVKAAMKARQQAAEAEKQAEAAEKTEDVPAPNPEQAQPGPGVQVSEQVVFDGGFFKVESPANQTGSVRRSSRLSATRPPPSPCSTYLSPRRVTRRSLALAQTPARTPTQLHLVLQKTPALRSQKDTPQRDAAHDSLCFSPLNEAPADQDQSEGGTSSAGQEENKSVPEANTPRHALPTIAVVDSQVETTEPANVSLPQSPAPAAEPASSPSPSGTSTQPPVQQQTPCPTPDELPGLDFERYLQPSLRGSLSPQVMDCSDIWSPTVADVEMGSPGGQHKDATTEGAPETTSVSLQTGDSAMLLFTPDVKDRIRQSVCPSDLMVFTPPNL